MDYEEQDWEDQPSWREKREMARALREQKTARLTRNAENAKALDGISRLEKRLRVNVADVIGKPPPKLPEPLDDQESNARERMLGVQAETLRDMSDEQYEARKKQLAEQAEMLKKKFSS